MRPVNPDRTMAQSSVCKECTTDISEMELHAEIDHLKRHLAERDAHIEAMEGEFLKGNTRITELEEQVVSWREKYDRLYDSHRRVQRLNQNLEEKLLQMVDKCTDDKSQLTNDVETLSVRLAELNLTIGHLHKENERYKNDMNLAIQLLQCKPDNFVSQKFDSLPPETQARVSSYIMSKAKLNQDTGLAGFIGAGKNTSLIQEKVNPDDFEFNISASLMSKILEESVQNTISSHCDTCTCLKKSINPFSLSDKNCNIGTQTNIRPDNCVHCSSELNSNKSSLTVKSPTKATNEEIDLIQITDKDLLNSNYAINKNQLHDSRQLKVDQISSTLKLKSNEDNSKIVALKHREIITKIGDDIKEINMKDRYTMPSLEPLTVHHRLCDRTKPPNNFNSFDDKKIENDTEISNKNKSANVNSLPAKQNVTDISFGQIEHSVLIPNIVQESKVEIPKVKSELNSLNSQRLFHGGSVSSNDTESKTSSNKSYQNGGSNPKVQIGPGPRFCSLIMQAGSKNILLDNAQPNIAPVLYTRQSRNLDTMPITSYNNDLDLGVKRNSTHGIDFNYLDPIGSEKHPINRLLDNVDNILDLPNEELLIRDPMDLSEKPESGYKSNESAEIIDKLLFGNDNIIVDNKLEPTIPIQPIYKEPDVKKETLIQIDEKLTNLSESMKNAQTQSDNSLVMNDNIKVFNFDHYEKSIKHSSTSVAHDLAFDINSEVKNADSQSFINDKTELYNTNIDLKIASKNLSEINKKFPIPDAVDNKKTKEWKKETSTEKSSSSLSSDDSAAVLQKQQLIRVAEWVQKNLEMEQQTDFDNSDSCHQSMEEMHHVRNDFPRPAKVDHRIRKGYKAAHHISKHCVKAGVDNAETNNVKISEPIKCEKIAMNHFPIVETDIDIGGDAAGPMINQYCKSTSDAGKFSGECTESTKSSASKVYTKQELARMEYNVKQFLLNGTRWTKGQEEEYCSKARRTSSKTETDL